MQMKNVLLILVSFCYSSFMLGQKIEKKSLLAINESTLAGNNEKAKSNVNSILLNTKKSKSILNNNYNSEIGNNINELWKNNMVFNSTINGVYYSSSRKEVLNNSDFPISEYNISLLKK
jgi:hypothetical protein